MKQIARYTFDEVCQITRLGRSTIRKRIKENDFPKPCDRGRQFLFRVSDIDNFLNSAANEPIKRDFNPDDFKKALARTCNRKRKPAKAAPLFRAKTKRAPKLAIDNSIAD